MQRTWSQAEVQVGHTSHLMHDRRGKARVYGSDSRAVVQTSRCNYQITTSQIECDSGCLTSMREMIKRLAGGDRSRRGKKVVDGDRKSQTKSLRSLLCPDSYGTSIDANDGHDFTSHDINLLSSRSHAARVIKLGRLNINLNRLSHNAIRQTHLTGDTQVKEAKVANTVYEIIS